MTYLRGKKYFSKTQYEPKIKLYYVLMMK